MESQNTLSICKVKKGYLILQRLVKKLGRFIMLLSFWMVQRLTREINTLERDVMKKHIELSNLQKYAGRLGGSSILGLTNIAGLSPELIPRASLFAQYSDQASSIYAMQNLTMMKDLGRVPMTNNPQMQTQIEMSAFAQFKEQALKELKQQEAAVLNEKEKEIELDLSEMNQRLSIKRAQLQSYEKLSQEDAQRWAPRFGS